MDDSILAAILAGVLVLVGVAWALWLAGWVRRVELVQRWHPTVAALGLRWLPHGVRPRVTAAGQLGGSPVELSWTARRLVVVQAGRRDVLPGDVPPEELERLLRRTPSGP